MQADKERAERQREFLAQLEREAAGFDESSEPTSMTNSSTVEGEHTIQGNDEDEDTLATDENHVDLTVSAILAIPNRNIALAFLWFLYGPS